MDISTYVTQLCQHAGLDEADVTVEVDQKSEENMVFVQLDVPQDDVGLFIGHRGESLAALQRMVRIVFGEQYQDQKLVININDYRQDRQQQLEDKTREIAEYVLEHGRSYRFPQLSSYERFIIHSAVTELREDDQFSQLESVSEGEGSGRRLVIRLKD